MAKVRTFKNETSKRLTEGKLYQVFLGLTPTQINNVISEAKKALERETKKTENAVKRKQEAKKIDLAKKLIAMGVDATQPLNTLLPTKKEPKEPTKKSIESIIETQVETEN